MRLYLNIRFTETPKPVSLLPPQKTIEYIGFQRQMRFRFLETLYAYGFTPWKSPILKSFTQGSELIFIDCLKRCTCWCDYLVWGSQIAMA